MYVIIKPPNRPSYRRSVNTPDGIATAFFEMACVGQKVGNVHLEQGDDIAPFDEVPAMSISTLDTLLEALQTARELAPDIVAEADLSNLPTFGGAVPSGTIEVWSGDESRFLVGSCILDMRIVPRHWLAFTRGGLL